MEAVAWSAALVLAAAVGVVGFGAISPHTSTISTQALAPPAAQDITPVLAAPAAVEQGAPSPAAVRARPRAVAPSQPRARVRVHRAGPPVQSSLGAPPGPQVDQVPARTAAPSDRYALIIGVTRYNAPTHPTIAGANDARYLQSSLLQAGWYPQNIRVLTDGQATGAAVRSGLDWLAGKGVAGTFSYFHFSGHVKQEGGHEKLWPVDRDFVPDNEVAAQLHRIQGHLWVDVAGCESGGFIEDLPSDRVLVSTSSRSSQKSYEYPQWGESVWTGLVYDLGLAQGGADANHDGVTTVGEALRYATYYAQSITINQQPYGRQTPQVAGDPVRGWTLANPPA